MKVKNALVPASLLPMMADMLEDAIDEKLFRYQMKHEAKKVINTLRYFDRLIMDTADLDAIEQQVLIQRLLRQFINEHFEE